MHGKSHFLAHFIPGMLTGAIVGLAFGSLWVASLIPDPVEKVIEKVVTRPSDENARWKEGPLNISLADDSQVTVSLAQYPLVYWLRHFGASFDLSESWTDSVAGVQGMQMKTNLMALASDCAEAHPETEVEKDDRLGVIAADFVQAAVTNWRDHLVYEYQFTSSDPSQVPHSWIVYAVPNAAGFKTVEEFKRAMNTCAVGGEAYPGMVSENWLTFSSSCGSGYTDGSGLPNGCDEAQKAVTIEWK